MALRRRVCFGGGAYCYCDNTGPGLPHLRLDLGSHGNHASERTGLADSLLMPLEFFTHTAASGRQV